MTIPIPSLDSIKKYGPYAVILVLVVVVCYKVLHPTVVKDTVTEYRPVETVRVVEKIKRVEVPVTTVRVIEKMGVAAETPLPPEVIANPNLQITAVGDVPPHDGDTKVVSIINTATGDTTLTFKHEAPDFFTAPGAITVGGNYGLTTTGASVMDIYVRWTPVCAGALCVNVQATLGANPTDREITEAKVTAGLAYTIK